LIHTGYPQRYCQVMGAKTAPLVVEAESAYRDLDATSANGIEYVRDHLCFPLAAGSFEEGMERSSFSGLAAKAYVIIQVEEISPGLDVFSFGSCLLVEIVEKCA